jgi:hypothetical protein
MFRRLPIILIALIAAGCDPPPQLLAGIETKSPDGRWIAGAMTIQFVRLPGSGVRTTVYLKSISDPKRESVLVFANEISKEKGKIDVAFHWIDRSHLEVMLSRLPTFDTQVTRYAGIDISVQDAIFDIQTPPSAGQIRAALSGSELKTARRLMLDLHCTPKTAEQLSAVRDAWHEIGSAASTEVTQDHLIQALMAQCLIEAQPQNATRDPDIESAVLLLRSAIQSQDLTEALAGAIGLIHFSDPRDTQSIVDVTHRFPATTNALRQSLSYSCAANAARTLELMRDQARNPATQAEIDANIKRADQQRREKCDANH